MRRFVFSVVLLALSLPIGLSTTGCVHDYGQNYCSGFQSGPLLTAVASVTMEPAVYGLSVSYGQIATTLAPAASNCKGSPITISDWTYGTSNLLLADISPTGRVCGGTWNRNSGNNIPNFTTCIPPQPGSAIYQAGGGIAYVTASAGGATSNPVPVFVHPPITSVILGGKSSVHTCPNNPSTGSPTNAPVYALNSCLSQNQTAQLAATVYNGTQDITCDAGHLTYTPQNPKIVSIDQNGVATALQPGATVVSATVAQATSAAGYFFTCPAKTIQLKVGTTNQSSVTVNPNNIQPLTATVLDTQGNPITGLDLTYSSSDPIDIPVGINSGSVAPAFPSDAAIVAHCLPSVCDPAPQDQIANLSTGLPITSNPIQVHTPGPSSNILYMSSPQSYDYVPVDFQSGTVGTPTRLPYQPNSMVMDELGNYLFFGSTNELMIVSISPVSGSQLINTETSVPGTVLAVAPDDSLVVIHDPCRQVFYLYRPPLGKVAPSTLTFGAPGPTVACNVDNQPIDPSVEVHPPFAASFTQDNQTVYIVGGNTLYTYNTFTGWHICTENGQTGNCPFNSTSVAATVTGVGAYASGSPTTAFGYCAIGPNNAAQQAGPPPVGLTDPDSGVNPTEYYPLAASVPTPTDQLAATIDGNHIIGATATSGGQLSDISVTIPSQACPLKTPLQFPSTPQQFSLGTSNIGSINQVLTSPDSQVAFVTFDPANPSSVGGNNLPAYQIPCTTAQITGVNGQSCPAGQATAGKVVDISLTGQAGAPIAGVFSPDTTTFYASTSKDDLVHFINTTTLTDTQQINPGLTCGTTTGTTSTPAPANPFLACTQGNPVPALFLASRPRPNQGAPVVQ